MDKGKERKKLRDRTTKKRIYEIQKEMNEGVIEWLGKNLSNDGESYSKEFLLKLFEEKSIIDSMCLNCLYCSEGNSMSCCAPKEIYKRCVNGEIGIFYLGDI